MRDGFDALISVGIFTALLVLGAVMFTWGVARTPAPPSEYFGIPEVQTLSVGPSTQ